MLDQTPSLLTRLLMSFRIPTASDFLSPFRESSSTNDSTLTFVICLKDK